MEKSYVVRALFSSKKFEPMDLPDVLVTLDVSTLLWATKFCDPNGYDVAPMRILEVAQSFLEYTSSDDYYANIFLEFEDDESNAVSFSYEVLDQCFIEVLPYTHG